MSDHMKINWSKADASAQIAALTAELETVKGERDAYKTEYEDACVDGMKQAARAEAAEAKLAGGEAREREAWEIGRRSYCPAGVLADEARTEREWQAARAALTHPAPTHNDGRGEAVEDHKWFDPECAVHGCQSLIWKALYESAVKGRQDFRKAFREARSTSHTSGEVTEAMVDTFKRSYRMHLGDGETPIDFKAAEREAVRVALEAALLGEAS
jgi:hypothetical protein